MAALSSGNQLRKSLRRKNKTNTFGCKVFRFILWLYFFHFLAKRGAKFNDDSIKKIQEDRQRELTRTSISDTYQKQIDAKNKEIEEKIRAVFDFRPSAIVRELKLRNPRYSITASGGHFGRPPSEDGDFEWEKLDESRLSGLRLNQN